MKLKVILNKVYLIGAFLLLISCNTFFGKRYCEPKGERKKEVIELNFYNKLYKVDIYDSVNLNSIDKLAFTTTEDELISNILQDLNINLFDVVDNRLILYGASNIENLNKIKGVIIFLEDRKIKVYEKKTDQFVEIKKLNSRYKDSFSFSSVVYLNNYFQSETILSIVSTNTKNRRKQKKPLFILSTFENKIEKFVKLNAVVKH